MYAQYKFSIKSTKQPNFHLIEKLKINFKKYEKFRLATLSGILSYVITMKKYRQIFVEEMLKEYNPDTPDLFMYSGLEGTLKFEQKIQISK